MAADIARKAYRDEPASISQQITLDVFMRSLQPTELRHQAPKREYVSYKVYQETIKEKRVKEQEVTKTESKSELMKEKKKQEQEERTKKKKSGSSILPSGQVGQFKNGTLILSPVEIKKIKSSRVIK
ncbi:UNVERIFIED_CONTAM: hypothetical protein FKN15_044261 [Acipenser sinensis]